jgi:uncharacterized repeat protein (TIGR01451 family)
MTLSNVGTAPLSVSAASISGASTADFSKVLDSCSGATVDAGSSCIIRIAFSPSARGLRSAALQITDDAAGSPQSVPLSGSGTAAVGQITPSSIDFGTVTVGSASARQTVTVANLGDPNEELRLTAESIMGPNASDFAIVSDGCITTSVLPASSCAIEVTFRPGAAGGRSASLSISDNGIGSPHTVALSGTGVTPSADLAVSISATPTSVKPGSKVTYTITIFNAGPSAAARILVNDTLSSQTTFVSAMVSQGTCVTPAKGASGVVSCSLASLASGSSSPIQIVVTVIAKKASFTNTVAVSAATADPNLANNTASITTRVK